MALSCMNLQLGYLGICHSESQRDLIMKRLEERAQELSTDPTTQFFNPSYTKLLESKKLKHARSSDFAGTEQSDDGDDEVPEPNLYTDNEPEEEENAPVSLEVASLKRKQQANSYSAHPKAKVKATAKSEAPSPNLATLLASARARMASI